MVAFFTSIGLKLLLGGKWLLGAIGRGLGWLVAKPIRIPIAIFAAALAWHLAVADPRVRADRDNWKTAAGNWKSAAHAWEAAEHKLVADVKAQRLAAEAADRANVKRVEREYQLINERTANDYQARLGDTRSAVERVRAQYAEIAERDPGDGGGADLPDALGARCRALGAADCNALLAALPDRLAAAEDNTAKLIGLQDYVRSSLLLDFSGARSSSAAVAQPKEPGR